MGVCHIQYSTMKRFLSTLLISLGLVACDNHSAVVDPVVLQANRITGTATIAYTDEATDMEYNSENDDQYTGDTAPGAKVASYPVWFQLRTDYDGSLSNNQTINVWDFTKSKSKWDQLIAAQGDPQNGSNFLYDGNMPVGVLPASPTKTYTTKKPNSQLYKRLTMKTGYYVIQTNDASTLLGNRWFAFQIADKELRFSTAYHDATDERDGLHDGTGRLKISIWNGAYKPDKVSVNLIPFDGATDLDHYNTIAGQGTYASIVVNSNQATGSKRACTYSQLSGDYMALYALSSDDIAEGKAIGLQRVTIAPGSKYPHLKIALATNPAN